MMWMLAGLAMAQDAPVTGGDSPTINGQLFNPSIDAQSTVWTNDSYRAPNAYTSARAVLHYVNDPVVYVSGNGDTTELVSGVWQMSVQGAHTRGPLRIGVDLPVYLRANGDNFGGETGLGDLALDLKLSALDRTEKPVGLAVAYRMGFPTASVSAPLGGDGLGWELGLIVDKEVGDNTLVAANLGTKGVKDVTLENLEYKDQFFWRLGVGHQLNEATGLSLDLVRHRTYGSAGEEAGKPLEALLGGSRRVGDTPFVARGAIGTGLNAGIGAPKYRLVFGFAWEPSEDKDTDLDGLMDSVDACPNEAEDADGVADEDGCPEPTKVTIIVVDTDGVAIEDATWTAGESSGASGEGLEMMDGDLSVEASHPDYVGALTTVSVNGDEITAKVELARIPGTLLVDAVDEDDNPVEQVTWRAMGTDIELQKGGEVVELPWGDYNIVVNAPGYKPKKERVVVTKETEKVVKLTMVPSKAKVTAEKIDISESVFFETGKAIIKSESYELLDDVAALLDAHPEITKLRVEGHTDDRGDDASNQDLSERRAAAVMEYMIDKGVSADRLESKGYGESKPLESNNTRAGRAKNRRVDFFVAERSDD